MKRILGLDLGTNSIGWALVNEAETQNENTSIIKLGVRVNPLTTDELTNFEKGKSITTNADRTLKRSMRRNLQRYKMRRECLIDILKLNGFINDDSLLSENGNKSTFETYRLRAKAATNKISLEEFGRVLLMINKKRGYKSSRKAKSQDEGQLIDGMVVAKKLYDDNITPAEYVLNIIKSGKKSIPDFYSSDLNEELNRIWSLQKKFYPDILTDDFKKQIEGRSKINTSKIFFAKYNIYTAENKGTDKRMQAYQWRVDGLHKQLSKDELAFVICDINGNINSSSGYLGAISDRSKELYFNKLTVGQYLIKQIESNTHTRLKGQVFYRQDYMDEFEIIWEKQAEFYPQLTIELKSEIRDVIIFYQRKLKSQKGLISFCEFESREVEIDVEGKKKKKTIGSRVCPRSSPLFQEYKIWQIINNIEVRNKKTGEKKLLEQEEKEILFKELNLKTKLSKTEALRLLYKNANDLDLNYKDIEGNRTLSSLFGVFQKIIELSGHGEYDFSKLNSDKIYEITYSVFSTLNINTDILKFNSDLDGAKLEYQAMYQLWHLLYSFEGDDSVSGNEKLIQKLSDLYGFEREYAILIANTTFQDDYSSVSSKAIRKILPHLKEGNRFDVACLYAGYKHSKNSETKEEILSKVLKEKLDIFPKNSLRNPVVEKILNQMINVVNTIIDTYGKPDEIKIELARELKKSAKEREEMTSAISKITTEHEKIKTILENEFGLTHVSRNDIIRYKLYMELEHLGYKTIYSNTYIPREKLFSKEFDIEHIIPQSRLFDDSFSNKTLELRSINIEKANDTAYDYVLQKYGEDGLSQYLLRLEDVFKNNKISGSKYRKLKMKGKEIPDDFIERDLRDTQYIAKKAKSILEQLVRHVISTTGSITDRLREDWQLVDVMKELNWDKYHALGMTEIIENKDGQKIRKIIDWTKRNDHRHHAMDALTVAFTKRSHIQYLNNLNARSDKSSSIYGIETKELYRDDKGKLKFKPPIPLEQFRTEAKKHLENTLISIKAKNKVVTTNINKTEKKGGINKKKQLTPRGQLHLETIYGSQKKYVVKEQKINGSFNEEEIAKVSKQKYRNALLKRLHEFGNDTKKAFTGKNSPDKNPIWIDDIQTEKVPDKVKQVTTETIYTIRKEINHELKIDKVVDKKIREKLQQRLDDFGGDAKKAFANLDENPIWLKEEKGIAIKRVTITGISNAIALHDKKDKDGNIILDEGGNTRAVDFVNTGNNHHVAIYRDENGNLQENVVSFFEATSRKNQNLPVIDKDFKKSEGWEFLFTLKQNEYFVFPNEKNGFNPNDIDLLNPENYVMISPNLYRVQSIGEKDYWFRHHLETRILNNSMLNEISYKRRRTPKSIKDIVKVRINHIGNIVSVGEY